MDQLNKKSLLLKYPQPYQKIMMLFGYLGLLASIGVGIGEFLVHYSGMGYGSDFEFGYLVNVSENRMVVGHFLMIVFIPLYIFGYMHLYLAFRPSGITLAAALFTLGLFAFVIGGIWVGSRAFLGHMVHAHASGALGLPWEEFSATYILLIENLVNILRFLVLAISVIFVIQILRGNTLYPKWMAFFNPILLLLIVFMLFFFLPAIGNYLIPTAMNIAHFVLFSASLYSLKKSLSLERN